MAVFIDREDVRTAISAIIAALPSDDVRLIDGLAGEVFLEADGRLVATVVDDPVAQASLREWLKNRHDHLEPAFEHVERIEKAFNREEGTWRHRRNDLRDMADRLLRRIESARDEMACPLRVGPVMADYLAALAEELETIKKDLEKY